MKRSGVTLLLLGAWLLMQLTVWSPQTKAAEETLEVTSPRGLHLRSGPGMGYRILATMPYGAQVTELDSSNGWYKVSYDRLVGWASGSFLSPVGSSQASTAPASSGNCVWNTWGQIVCASTNVANAIYSAAATYGVSASWLMRVAACESNFNPDVIGSAGEIGIFQFLPDTFYTYSNGDIGSVWDQAYTAAWMFSQGLSYLWTCASR